MFNLVQGPFGPVFGQANQGSAAVVQVAPTITTTSLPAATVGVAYSAQLAATGDPATFTWLLTSGNKPAWLTVSTGGALSGTPQAGDVTTGLNLTFSCSNGVAPNATSGNLSLVVISATVGTPVPTVNPTIHAWRTSPAGSILEVTPASYVNQYNYALTGTTSIFSDTTIKLDGGSTTNGAYVGFAICWLNEINPGLNRVITAYDGATQTATLSYASWTANTGVGPNGVPPRSGVSVWALCNDYPVERRFQWIKDGVDIPGAVGGSFTPYSAGSYQVRETAYYPSTSRLTTSTISAAFVVTGARDPNLVYEDNLVWQGCFMAPALWPGNELSYGGALAYNAAGDGGAGSLFVAGKSEDGFIGEISIPIPGKTLPTVPTARLLHTSALVDPLEGQRESSGLIGGGITPIGGMLVDGGKLIITANPDYSNVPAGWFWRRTLDLSITGAIEGPFSVTDLNPALPGALRGNPRCYAGYLASVPTSLQAKLGGPVVAGLSAGSVVANTSDGPTFASFDPSNFTTAAPNVKRGSFVGATANTMDLSGGSGMSSTNDFYNGYYLVSSKGSFSIKKVTAYDGASKVATVEGNWTTVPTSGDWVLIPHVAATALSMYTPGQLQAASYLGYGYIWDEVSSPVGGAAIPNGTRSVLAFSKAGGNMYTYSSPDQVRLGVKTYDPGGGGTGEHNYPYFARCWAYDANELEQAKLGNVTPGSLKPYAVWNFETPLHYSNGIKGAAYDAANRRLFLTNNSGPNARVVVHVYTISNASV